MEKKTTQRIIGILVAIALLVVLMPLVFSKNELTQTAAIKAPPFPDQQKSDENTTSAVEITQDMADKVNGGMVVAAAEPTKQLNESAPITEAATQSQTNPDTMNQPSVIQLPSQTAANSTGTTMEAAPKQPKDLAPQTPAVQSDLQENTVVPSLNPPATPDNSAVEDNAPQKLSHSDKTRPSAYSLLSSDPKPQESQMPSAQVTEKEQTNFPPKHFNHNKYSSRNVPAQQTGWVIQMGSFKDKANAHRLVNRLRASGYKAFVREVRGHTGSRQTRVYVGPEPKQVATKLSGQLQHDLNLHGLLIAYKPFAL